MTVPCYVYSRVSLEVQVDRTGLERQKSMALDWLSKHPEYHLEEVLSDDGRSAYKGHLLEHVVWANGLEQLRNLR